MNRNTAIAIAWKKAKTQPERSRWFLELHKASEWLYKWAYKHVSYASGSRYEDFRTVCTLELHATLLAYNPELNYAFNTYFLYRLNSTRLNYLQSLCVVRPPTRTSWEATIEHSRSHSSLTPMLLTPKDFKGSQDALCACDEVYENCNPIALGEKILSGLESKCLEAYFKERGGAYIRDFVESITGVTYEWASVNKENALKKLRKLFEKDIRVMEEK